MDTKAAVIHRYGDDDTLAQAMAAIARMAPACWRVYLAGRYLVASQTPVPHAALLGRIRRTK